MQQFSISATPPPHYSPAHNLDRQALNAQHEQQLVSTHKTQTTGKTYRSHKWQLILQPSGVLQRPPQTHTQLQQMRQNNPKELQSAHTQEIQSISSKVHLEGPSGYCLFVRCISNAAQLLIFTININIVVIITTSSCK
jgi:hypothetical protein